MTRQLKDLMDQATDRSAPYVPDLDQLLTAGRRDVRKRRVLAALTSTAAVVLVTCVSALAVNVSHGPVPDPASEGPPPPAPDRIVTVKPSHPVPTATKPFTPSADTTLLCETKDRKTLTGNAAPWTVVVVSAADADGTSSVLRSPTTGEVAFCTTRVPVTGTAKPLRAAGFWTGPLGFVNYVHRFDGTGCGSAERHNCDGATLGFSGRLPVGVTRVVLEAAGRTKDAVIKDGFYAIRLFEPNTGSAFVPGKLKFYLASGALLVDAQG